MRPLSLNSLGFCQLNSDMLKLCLRALEIMIFRQQTLFIFLEQIYKCAQKLMSINYGTSWPQPASALIPSRHASEVVYQHASSLEHYWSQSPKAGANVLEESMAGVHQTKLSIASTD